MMLDSGETVGNFSSRESSRFASLNASSGILASSILRRNSLIVACSSLSSPNSRWIALSCSRSRYSRCTLPISSWALVWIFLPSSNISNSCARKLLRLSSLSRTDSSSSSFCRSSRSICTKVAMTYTTWRGSSRLSVAATFVQMDLELRQKLLELDSVRDKLESLSSFLAHELEIFELGRKIQTSAQEEMGKVQREYLLREQLKAIQRELGEESEEQATINELRRKIDEARMPEEAFKEANRELSRLEKLPTVSPEYSIIRTYLELFTSLPWSKSTGEKIDVPRAREVLNKDHYDLEKIKDRILEYLAVRRLKEERMEEQTHRSKETAAAEKGVGPGSNESP